MSCHPTNKYYILIMLLTSHQHCYHYGTPLHTNIHSEIHLPKYLTLHFLQKQNGEQCHHNFIGFFWDYPPRILAHKTWVLLDYVLPDMKEITNNIITPSLGYSGNIPSWNTINILLTNIYI